MGLQGSSIGSPGRFMISRAFQGIPGVIKEVGGGGFRRFQWVSEVLQGVKLAFKVISVVFSRGPWSFRRYLVSQKQAQKSLRGS